MFTDDRNAYRQTFFQAWEKHKKKLPLEPVEAQLIDIIIAHPEYHDMLDNPKKYANAEFDLQENPFFHISMHLSLHEQISMDRPAGIKKIHADLVARFKHIHAAEHQMINVLAQIMYESQQSGKMPDESEYLQKLREL